MLLKYGIFFLKNVLRVKNAHKIPSQTDTHARFHTPDSMIILFWPPFSCILIKEGTAAAKCVKPFKACEAVRHITSC